MEPDYWRQRWAEGRTGWHQPEVNALLRQHFPALSLPRDSRVFVPLCGKSADMAWLAAQGHRVLGVELAHDACAAFFAEHGLVPKVTAHGALQRYRSEPIELLAGDAFALSTHDLADCAACYDRAALIALPDAMRQRYAELVLGKLPSGCRTLLVTLDYPQHEKQGPPFSVDQTEVERLFAANWHVALLERRDILAQQPGFQAEGVTRLHTAAYRLTKVS
ncbi:MAG: thiopurine S-methyltransferase [Gammaproteobacteria bacterium HGW-Gammaproteobacteria-4]|nr:MAG: thiopurine S-methyltransferase [Gammaproteobacteria bacterium HGW-Gammaproteobacteria-4]